METYTYKLVEDKHGNIQCGDKLYKFEETTEEEKKIPEKLDYKYRNLYGRLSQHKQSEIDIIDTLNGVIDYLKSKGDK